MYLGEATNRYRSPIAQYPVAIKQPLGEEVNDWLEAEE